MHHLPWRRVDTCEAAAAESAQQKLCILLPPPDNSWSLVESEAAGMLNDVVTYVQNALPKTANHFDDHHSRGGSGSGGGGGSVSGCSASGGSASGGSASGGSASGGGGRLTYQQLFKLRRVVECLTICGLECELLQTWKHELTVICKEFAGQLIRNYPDRSLEDLGSQAKIFLAALRSLSEAGAPLDANYTLKTSDLNTRSICCGALKQYLSRSDENLPYTSALDALVSSIWMKMIERESQILSEPLDQMVASLQDPSQLDVLQTLSEFLNQLDVVTPEFLSNAVDSLLDVVLSDLRNSSTSQTPARSDQSLIIKKLLKAADLLAARLPQAFRGDCYRPMRSLFAQRLKSRLFQQDDPTDGEAPKASGIWLTQPYHRRQVVDLNGIRKPIIETHTIFEWIFLHDGESWRALNELAGDSPELYINNILLTWSKFLSRTCSALVEDCSDVTPAALTESLLVWIARLTALPEAMFGKAVNKHAREALLLAFKNAPIICEAFTEYVESLWQANASESDYLKVITIFRALSNKALAQSLLEAALLRTLLIKNTTPRICLYFIELIQAECGENYVSNMKAALNEFTDSKLQSATDGMDPADPTASSRLSVKVISARLYNSQCASDKKVVPSATSPALPKWSLPPRILQDFQTYIDSYKQTYQHRLLTFALEVSSATIVDLRNGQTLEVSASQFALLDLFNTEEALSAERIEELYKDGQGGLVVASLAPLIRVREDGAVLLNGELSPVIDYRGQWLAQWAGSERPGTGTNSPMPAAVRASVTLFHDVGLDALIMRTLKQNTLDFRLLKTVIDLYASEHFGSHPIPENVIREHLERLRTRDFISIDQNIISLTS